MNTAKSAWLVGRQFSKTFERFTDKNEAENFAQHYAKRVFPEKVEVFECVNNVFLDVPVSVVSEADKP